MVLLDFPAEVLLCIADKLDKAKDLFALSCLTRATNFLFLPYLYNFNVRYQRSSALLWGVVHNQPSLVDTMCQYQADTNTTDEKSRTPIFHAIHAENVTMIRRLLSDKRTDINWQDRNKQTPLLYAMGRRLSSIALLLLDFKPFLDEKDRKQRSAIWYAIAHCDEGLVQALLQRGSDVRRKDYKGRLPTDFAIFKENENIIRMLLYHPDPKTGKSLLEDGNARDRYLRRAVKASLQDIILLLVAHGADPNIRNDSDETLLHQAADKGDKEMALQLLKCEKTSVNARDSYGRTPFQIAAENGHKAITRLLLTHSDVDINALDFNGATALCLAIQNNNTDIAMQILAEDHVEVNAAGRRGMAALHSATEMGNIPIIAALLAKNDLDPNTLDEEKWAPLTHAAFRGDLRVVELFLGRADIDMNVQTAPPIFHAAREGHIDVLRRLLCRETIYFNHKYGCREESPLCVASKLGHIEITRLLLRHKPRPDINFKTYMEYTPLILAASGGHLGIVELLLEDESLDVAATDISNDTALCHAARNGHEQVVMRLCEDPRARSGDYVKKAIKEALHCEIRLYLHRQLNEQGNLAIRP
ncbi:uncharacterized protein N7469_001982 [Penicillium citrinum]|uniref:Ankyrin repeat protein n=1 Tax=Penicillium citrinum TaxID=5077 RepID=A0A9W9P9E4_PENCI|nr:uncharacterized protein N7469_001982 [Penicillium citrinum]KAJ5240391.1 hypothetical protein N7469_001982 [Penicillium citrinum]